MEGVEGESEKLVEYYTIFATRVPSYNRIRTGLYNLRIYSLILAFDEVEAHPSYKLNKLLFAPYKLNVSDAVARNFSQDFVRSGMSIQRIA